MSIRVPGLGARVKWVNETGPFGYPLGGQASIARFRRAI
jgi:hypothetical protein